MPRFRVAQVAATLFTAPLAVGGAWLRLRVAQDAAPLFTAPSAVGGAWLRLRVAQVAAACDVDHWFKMLREKKFAGSLGKCRIAMVDLIV